MLILNYTKCNTKRALLIILSWGFSHCSLKTCREFQEGARSVEKEREFIYLFVYCFYTMYFLAQSNLIFKVKYVINKVIFEIIKWNLILILLNFYFSVWKLRD